MSVRFPDVLSHLREQIGHLPGGWREGMALPERVYASFVGQAESLAEPAPPEPPRRLGLVLGGGGGKGAAHLGVLAAMEALEVPIDLIVGTSAGGFAAVAYAAGYRPHQITALFKTFGLRRVAVADPTRTGFIGARKREQILLELFGDRTFADLGVPVAVVTTDLASGQVVTIGEGPLVPAIMATTALPGIFPPVICGDQVLADGGVLNNVPVDVAERLGATRVIAVQLSTVAFDTLGLASAPSSRLARLTLAPRQFALANRALDLMIAQATAMRLEQHPPALLLRPEVGQIGLLDMSRAEEGYRAGEQAALDASEELAALRVWRVAPPIAPSQPQPRRPAPWWAGMRPRA
jgi:NTE family protein